MRKVVKWDDLVATSSSIVVAKKGGGGPEYELSAPGPGLTSTGPSSMLSLGFGAGRAVADSLGLSAGLRIGFEPTTESGLTFSVLGSYASGTGLTEGGVQGRTGYRFGFEVSRFWFGIGAEAGVGVFWQTFPDASGASQLTGTVSFLLAARGTARMKIVGPLWLALDVDIAGGLLRLDDQWKIVPLPTGTLGLALAL
jgi:hypothetical protein